MSPPRVKVYGLLSLTKRQYLLSLLLGLFLLLVLLAVWYRYLAQLIQHPWTPYFPIFLLFMCGLEAIEVMIVLGKFRRLEAEAKHCPATSEQKGVE